VTKTKKCCRCGRVKPVSEFPTAKNTSDGIWSWCLVCKRAYQLKSKVVLRPQGTPGYRRCLGCGRMWLSPGPANRICPRCTKGNAEEWLPTVFRAHAVNLRGTG